MGISDWLSVYNSSRKSYPKAFVNKNALNSSAQFDQCLEYMKNLSKKIELVSGSKAAEEDFTVLFKYYKDNQTREPLPTTTRNINKNSDDFAAICSDSEDEN
jgi:hypothetical protein